MAIFYKRNFGILNQQHEVVVVFIQMDRCTHIPIQDSSWHHSEWGVNLSCAVFGTNESEYSPRIIGLYKSFG